MTPEDPLRGPWQAVIADRWGFVYTSVEDARDNVEDPEAELTIAVVRGTAAPDDRGGTTGCRLRMPGSWLTGDMAYELDDVYLDHDPSIAAAARWAQAQAMAAGLNAAAGQDRGILVEELIERSSLGTPEAQALRASTPGDVVDRIVQRAEQLAEIEGLRNERDAARAEVEQLREQLAVSRAQVAELHGDWRRGARAIDRHGEVWEQQTNGDWWCRDDGCVILTADDLEDTRGPMRPARLAAPAGPLPSTPGRPESPR